MAQEALKWDIVKGGPLKIGSCTETRTRHVNSHCSFQGNLHAPQKHYLPEKSLPEFFLKLPLPDLSFSELISQNYPTPSVFV